MTDPIKIRISSAAFMNGRLQVISSASSCLRNILLRKHGVDAGPIPEKYTVLGAINEERFEALFKKDERFDNVDREVWLEVSPRDGVVHRGRCDFLLRIKEQDTKAVFEMKSADSTNTRDNVIRKGLVAEKKSDNLAQLVTYMIASETTTGFLIYTWYKQELDEKGVAVWQPKEERSFRVDILDDGKILIDRKDTGYSVYDRYDHMQAQEKVLLEDVIWDRPKDWDHKFASPCKFCPWQTTCTAYENGDINSVVEFVEYAKTSVKGTRE